LGLSTSVPVFTNRNFPKGLRAIVLWFNNEKGEKKNERRGQNGKREKVRKK
jgi:hypothetical protein